MQEIKELFTDLLIFGHTTSKPQLITMISLLYDKTFDADYSNVELNGNSIFVERCLPYFLAAKKQLERNEDVTEIDHFIHYYKQLLLKDEQYEVITFLRL